MADTPLTPLPAIDDSYFPTALADTVKSVHQEICTLSTTTPTPLGTPDILTESGATVEEYKADVIALLDDLESEPNTPAALDDLLDQEEALGALKERFDDEVAALVAEAEEGTIEAAYQGSDDDPGHVIEDLKEFGRQMTEVNSEIVEVIDERADEL